MESLLVLRVSGCQSRGKYLSMDVCGENSPSQTLSGAILDGGKLRKKCHVLL